MNKIVNKKNICLLLGIIINLVAYYLFSKLLNIIVLILNGMSVDEAIYINTSSLYLINEGTNIPLCLLMPILVLIIINGKIYLAINARKNFRYKEEYGSAKWGTEKTRQKLIDYNKHNKPSDKNIILSQNDYLSMNTWKTGKNNNVIIIGGSGSGKTRYWVKPNLLQAHSSYVITDPKGELYDSTKDFFINEGYTVKVLNLINPELSNHYNPIEYMVKLSQDKIQTEIYKILGNLFENTEKEGAAKGDAFWDEAGKLLLTALFALVIYEGKPSEQNLNTVMALLQEANVKEDDEDYETKLDIMFKTLEEENPNHFAVINYNEFKKSAGKTAKSILITLAARFKELRIDSLMNLLSSDEMELNHIGLKKMVFYVIIPDATDKSLNFLVGLLYTQMFDINFRLGDQFAHGLPVPIRFVLDEFANSVTRSMHKKIKLTNA